MRRAERQTSVVSGLRAFAAAVERSRGTGPRATVGKLICLAKSPLILQILEILEILLQTIGIARDRPPRYELRTFFGMALKHRDREGSPTRTSLALRPGGRADWKKSRPGGLSYQEGLIFALPPRGDNYRNRVMKHPQLDVPNPVNPIILQILIQTTAAMPPPDLV